MKTTAAIFLVMLGLLQFRLWAGEGSLRDLWRLQDAVQAQTEQNAALRERNDRLSAEVKDLKEGLDAIEHKARTDLGMIRRDETYYQFVDE